jgi:pyridinium-3,5-bisthiocarboxylic acid mononucleotide nickel chelatase
VTTAWFQCLAGASGDMLLGALLDAGASLPDVQAAVDSVATERIRIATEPVTRQGLGATKAHVHVEASSVVRTWANIRGLLESADLAEPVRTRALAVFELLAAAEAQAHRTSPDQVHFHEVGALDAIADVVGVCAALASLDVTDAACSAVALGSGMVRSSHGLLPVPGPAVLSLLADAGAPVYSGDVPHELCTPTGAAILAATVTSWGGLPLGRIVGSGFGAGARDLDELPNVVRVVLLEPADPVEGLGTATEMPTQLLLETNVDDLDPRVWPAVLRALLAAGAADAWLSPILMKKGRPAHTLSVLVPHDAADAVRRVVFTETSAIGLREHAVGKRALDRAWVTVAIGEASVRIKTASLDGVVVNAQPEYDDVAAIAERTGRPVKSVLADAIAAAHAAGLLT